MSRFNRNAESFRASILEKERMDFKQKYSQQRSEIKEMNLLSKEQLRTIDARFEPQKSIDDHVNDYGLKSHGEWILLEQKDQNFNNNEATMKRKIENTDKSKEHKKNNKLRKQKKVLSFEVEEEEYSLDNIKIKKRSYDRNRLFI